MSHPKFNYDTRADLEDLAGDGGDDDYTLLCQRSFTEGLHAARGRVKVFKHWIENSSDFLPRDVEMFLTILNGYVEPTFEMLCRGRGIDPAAITEKKPFLATAPEATTESEAEDASIEDDKSFFVDSPLTGKVRAKNPYEVEIAMTNLIKEW
jgi:hypothetical protein